MLGLISWHNRWLSPSNLCLHLAPVIWVGRPSVPVSGAGKSKPSGCLDAVGTGATEDPKNNSSENIWDRPSSSLT